MSTEYNNDTDQYSQRAMHRSRRSRSSRHSHLKIWGLSLALLAAIVILFISFVYYSSRIEKLTTQADAVQKQLYLKEQEVEELKSSLSNAQNEREKLIAGRLPSVMKLVPDKVLVVDGDYIKNIVFSVINQGGSRQYEYKLVVENPSHKNIVPKFRVLVFDKYGIQIGIDQVLKGDELAPGESRSYSSQVDFFMEEEPAYFHVSSLIPPGAERMENLLK